MKTFKRFLNESREVTLTMSFEYRDEFFEETIDVPSKGKFFVYSMGNDEGFTNTMVIPTKSNDPVECLSELLRDTLLSTYADELDNQIIDDVESKGGLYLGKIDASKYGLSTAREMFFDKNALKVWSKEFLEGIRSSVIDRDSAYAMWLFYVENGKVGENYGSSDGDPDLTSPLSKRDKTGYTPGWEIDDKLRDYALDFHNKAHSLNDREAFSDVTEDLFNDGIISGKMKLYLIYPMYL